MTIYRLAAIVLVAVFLAIVVEMPTRGDVGWRDYVKEFFGAAVILETNDVDEWNTTTICYSEFREVSRHQSYIVRCNRHGK